MRVHSMDKRTAVAVVVRALVDDPRASRVELVDEPDGSLVAVVHADGAPKDQDLTELRTRLDGAADADPHGTLHLEYQRPHATQEVLLRTEEVPGFGWRGLAPAELGSTAVRVEGRGLTNGLITVIPDPSTGTFSLDGTPGLGRIVDDGDSGDTYNWSPPAIDRIIERPEDVEVVVSEAGPVRGRIDIARTYRWPLAVHDGHRVGEVTTVVHTRLELRAGEDLLRLSVRFENRSSDHRVRIWFPLPRRATGSEAECAFATVRRGLIAEGGPNEVGLPTFPSRRFVRAGGLTVVHDGLPEYELVDLEGGAEVGDDESQPTAGAVAVTLLRGVGVISAGPMAMRPLPAGPPTPTPAAQLHGPHRFDLVLHVGDRDPYAVADDAFTPVLVARFPGSSGLGDPEASGQALAVTGAEVSALCRRPDGRTEVRVVNTTDAPTTVAIEGRTGELTDLAGRPTGERFDTRTTLRPHQIATIALD
jgi:hypothetical protein